MIGPMDIDQEKVIGVLWADGWHTVEPGTFRIREVSQAKEQTFWFRYRVMGTKDVVTGPLANVLAVREAHNA